MAGQTFSYDTKYLPSGGYGLSAGLPLEPALGSPQALGKEVLALERYWDGRASAFRRWENLRKMVDNNRGVGLESMVTNDARTMFNLAVFLSSSPAPRRSVNVGGQGARAERKSGKAERALESWWASQDEHRLRSGLEPFRQELAYWMCLYGWYSVMYGVDEKGIPFARPLNPAWAYPQYADGLERFVYYYETTVAEARHIGEKYNVQVKATDALQRVQIAEWWHRDEGYCHHAVLAHGLGRGWVYLAEPHEVNIPEIPVLCGPVMGSPARTKADQEEAGSVLYENERVYEDFNRWLSFLMRLSKEHAQAPLLAKNIEFDTKDLRPSDIRDTGAIITTDDPEANIIRVQPGPSVVEVQQFLGLIDAMLQRGGFPYVIYGGLGRELSGFAISQLIQTAERKIGSQVNRMAAIDAIISQTWLESFREGDFGPQTISGLAPGGRRELYVEDFAAKDVPTKFKVMTEIPIRVGNDLMARMAIARQALGQGPLLDLTTILEQILQQDDPVMVTDGMAKDAARQLILPLQAALELKMEAASLRESGKPGAAEVAALAESLAAQIVAQAQAQQGQAQAPGEVMRPNPAQVSPEAAGISPDVIRAAMSTGPANVPAERQ